MNETRKTLLGLAAFILLNIEFVRSLIWALEQATW